MMRGRIAMQLFVGSRNSAEARGVTEPARPSCPCGDRPLAGCAYLAAFLGHAGQLIG
jgi:hypothetical protein